MGRTRSGGDNTTGAVAGLLSHFQGCDARPWQITGPPLAKAILVLFLLQCEQADP